MPGANVSVVAFHDSSASARSLVIKGVHRIEAITPPWKVELRPIEIYTHTFSRVVRRDFNLTCVKLFWFVKQGQQREEVRPLLHNLLDEARALENLARSLDMPSTAVAVSCALRIISNEAEMLCDALTTADRALHKINHSALAEMAEETLAPFLRSFCIVRRLVFGFQPKLHPNTIL